MEYLAPGLVSGSILLLATVGFALIRRVEGFLNVAHAQILVVGGYAAYLFNVTISWPLVPGALMGIVVAAATGVLSARLVFWPLRGLPHVIPLIASVGLAFLIHGVTVAIAGVGVRTLDLPIYRTIDIGGTATASPDQIFIVAAAAAAVGVLHLWLTRTYSGRAIRAMANNPQLAQVRGINTNALLYVVWAVSSGLAGFAGVLISISTRVYPEMGWNEILLIITAAIVGGLGSVYGVMVAALLVGLAASMTALVLPLEYGQIVVFGLIIIVIFVRPQGIARA